jgi:beta-galactosidase
MRRRAFLELIGLSAVSTPSFAQTPRKPAGEARPLTGQWRFALDRDEAGLKEEWFARDLLGQIALPGILQAQGYGDEISVDTPWVAALPRDMRWFLLPEYQAYTKPGNVKVPYLSQPPRHYLGLAWYQREIEIPAAWASKRATLFLERPRWETTVYVDSRRFGSCRSLVAPHAYDLGTLSPGRHRLTISIDNRMILPYRPDGHSVSDALGATWNGVVGKIELAATSPVWIEDAQLFPDIARKSVRIRLAIGNSTGKPGSGTLRAGRVSMPVKWEETGGSAELEVPLGASAPLWSEFNPALHHLSVRLTGSGADHTRAFTFGLREIRRDGRHILLNGDILSLRITHFGGDFPLTGFPATDAASWKRIIAICKSFGLNGIRFHSWCPPEAAFDAADELGFYLQPECGMWNSFDAEGKMLAVLNDETARLLKASGNHPSFILLAATNEPAGHYQEQLPQWDAKWRAADSRRLYTDGTGRPAIPPAGQPYASDFVIIPATRAGRARGQSGWFGADYQSAFRDLDVPALAHEIGQYCAYPDFSVIGKFTGYLRPGNYEIIRDSAAAHGLLEKNKDLAHASGRFQLACYKEEIEANLRTAGYSGFELLDLHDYLGQGTALIGLLDAFWESKGYVTAAEFRRFCDVTVPLARLRERVYSTADSLSAPVEIAHFGDAPLADAVPQWRIEDMQGKIVAQGEWPARTIPRGKNIPLGEVQARLGELPAPRAYKLIVGLRGKKVENDWNFWLYPAQVPDVIPAGVLLTKSWSEAEKQLASGGRVLFQPDPSSAGPAISTAPIFWNRLMNPNGPWMLGLWCDANHPALAGFPTASWCDWQWTNLFRGLHALNLEALPRDLQPIVQPIDDWNRNTRFGLIYECRVGPGRLLVCAFDLAADRPGAKSLRRSLLDYMAGDRFQPPVEIPAAALG